jgi:hypothetical protein
VTQTQIVRMQQRADTTAGWTAKNPVLLMAEEAWDSTVEKFKVGDGVHTWIELDYYEPGSTTPPSGPTYPAYPNDSWILPVSGGAFDAVGGPTENTLVATPWWHPYPVQITGLAIEIQDTNGTEDIVACLGVYGDNGNGTIAPLLAATDVLGAPEGTPIVAGDLTTGALTLPGGLHYLVGGLNHYSEAGPPLVTAPARPWTPAMPLDLGAINPPATQVNGFGYAQAGWDFESIGGLPDVFAPSGLADVQFRFYVHVGNGLS